MDELKDDIRQKMGIAESIFSTVKEIEKIMIFTYKGKDYIYFRYMYKGSIVKFNKAFELREN